MQSDIHILTCEDARAFVCDAPWGIALVNPDGTFDYVNRSYCEILNTPIELIVGTHFADKTHPQDKQIYTDLAKQVADGVIPGYTLATRYEQRGSTPQKPRTIWGMLTVSGKWLQTQEFAGYRLQFQPYEQRDVAPSKLAKVKAIADWIVANWRTLVTIAAVATSLTAGASVQLSDILNRAKETAASVEQALPPSPSGVSQAQP